MLWSPSPEDQLTALQRQDSTRKISEPGWRGHRDQEEPTRKGRRECLHLERMEPPKASTEPPLRGAPMGSRFLQRKKESPRWTPSTLSICRCILKGPLRSFIPRGSLGNVQSLTTDGRAQACWGKQHQGGSGLRSSLQQPPIDIPARGLSLGGAEPLAPSYREVGRQLCSVWISRQRALSTSVDPTLRPCLGREAP